MSGPEDFDPYHRWLGIPAEEQPANYYRLLGLVAFEADPEVIRDGAERQMAHVRRYALGPRVAISQKILNELGRAKSCLTDPERKGQYDCELRAKLAVPAAAPVAVPVAVPIAVPVPEPAVPVPPPSAGITLVPASEPVAAERPLEPTPELMRRRAAQASAGQRTVVIGAAAAAGVIAIVGVLLALSMSRPKPAPVTETVAATPQTMTLVPSSQPSGGPAAPKLGIRPTETAYEGSPIQLQVPLQDPRPPEGAVVFRLEGSVPAGAQIDPQSGLITWTPTAEDVGRPHEFQVVAALTGNQQLSSRTTLYVNVLARRPVLEPPSTASLTAGQPESVYVQAHDVGGSPRPLRFSLLNAPAWASIDATSGQVTLKPDEETTGTFQLMLHVAAEGYDRDFDEKPLTVVVREAPPPVGDYEIHLPSGKVVSTGSMPTRDQAQKEADSLIQTAKAENASHRLATVAGFYFDEKQGTLSSICQIRDRTILDGTAVFFYPDQSVRTLAKYQRGILQGSQTRLTETGGPDFFCQYEKGKRNGLCCLLENAAVSAVLEYDAGNVTAVYLVKGKRIAKSFNTAEAWGADTAAAAAVEKADSADSAVRKEGHDFQLKLVEEIHKVIGQKAGIVYQPGVPSPRKRSGVVASSMGPTPGGTAPAVVSGPHARLPRGPAAATEPDTRTQWHSDTYNCTFSKTGPRMWTQTDNKGKHVADFSELSTRPDYIELVLRGRTATFYRIYATEMKMKRGPTWTVEQTGSWVSP